MTRSGNDEGGAGVRREEILAIAAQEFAVGGYAGTTMRKIADKSGILAGSLYHHFPSKEAIFDEILRDLMDDSVARYESAVHEGRGPLEIMDLLTAHALTIIEQRHAQVLMYQNERAFLHADARHAYVLRASARMEDIWIEQLTEGKRRGLFREDIDCVVMSRFIRDAIWSAVRWFTPGSDESVEALTVQFTSFLHGGLVASRDGK